jgi:hypothetical protein
MVRSGSSYLSHSDPVLAFGLGQAGRIGRLRIQWPDRTEEVLDGVEAGAHYWVEQGQGIVQRRPFGRRSG